MAKITDLNVTTLKIKNGAITQFFTPYSGSLGANRYINITYDNYQPVALIFIDITSGTCNLYYKYGESDQDLIQTATGPANLATGDSRPNGTYTYTLQGGTGTITGALIRYR